MIRFDTFGTELTDAEKLNYLADKVRGRDLDMIELGEQAEWFIDSGTAPGHIIAADIKIQIDAARNRAAEYAAH